MQNKVNFIHTLYEEMAWWCQLQLQLRAGQPEEQWATHWWAWQQARARWNCPNLPTSRTVVVELLDAPFSESKTNSCQHTTHRTDLFALLLFDNVQAFREYRATFPHSGIALSPPYPPLLVLSSQLHSDAVQSSHLFAPQVVQFETVRPIN